VYDSAAKRHFIGVNLQAVPDTTIIGTPSPTKNQGQQRDTEMASTKMGSNYHFGMKAHTGVDVDSGLVHSLHTTPANEHDITQSHELLHGQGSMVFADAGYIGLAKRDEIVQAKAQIRARVEHPYHVIKDLFGYRKVRYNGLKKNTAQLHTLFALANLYMARKRLMARCVLRQEQGAKGCKTDSKSPIRSPRQPKIESQT
jgi:IS5 family transposase